MGKKVYTPRLLHWNEGLPIVVCKGSEVIQVYDQ